ncbi:PAS domain-containing protein [Magnetococcales bacterium HHB-1]
MSIHYRYISLILIMAALSLSVGGIGIWSLYGTALDEQKARLQEVVVSQARLIEAMYRFNTKHSIDYPGGSEAATISQIREAHDHFPGFGSTGEFALARKKIDQIIFLLRHRHHQLDQPAPIPYQSKLAEPMRQALSGHSGIIIGLDYRGEMVMAAHEPLPLMGWGAVAKMDLAEVRAPFIRMFSYWMLFALLLVGVGTFLFYKIGYPIIRQLQASEADIKTTLNSIGDAVIACDCNGLITRMNPVAEELTGWPLKEAMDKPLLEVFRIISSLTREAVVNPVEKVLKERRIVGLANHTELISRDGHRIQIADSGAPIREQSGEISGVVLVFRDVTESYERERKLQESETRYRTVVEETPALICHFKPDGELCFVNKAYGDYFNRHYQDLAGTSFLMLIPEQDRESVLSKILSITPDDPTIMNIKSFCPMARSVGNVGLIGASLMARRPFTFRQLAKISLNASGLRSN